MTYFQLALGRKGQTQIEQSAGGHSLLTVQEVPVVQEVPGVQKVPRVQEVFGAQELQAFDT